MWNQESGGAHEADFQSVGPQGSAPEPVSARAVKFTLAPRASGLQTVCSQNDQCIGAAAELLVFYDIRMHHHHIANFMQ